MEKILIIVLIAFLPFWGCRSLSGEKEKKETVPGEPPIGVNEKTNIHYTGKYCDECHEKTPVKGGDAYLKFNGDYRQLCRCHHGMSPGYCHPIEISGKEGKILNLPADFPVKNGKSTCNTCHDIYKQCQKRLFDRNMLRGEPYPRKTDFCYKCHDRKNYKELDVHHQINTDGKMIINLCLYCHEKKPDEKTATYKEITFIGDLTALCQRCHQIRGNHPANFDHIGVTPSATGVNRMEAMKVKFDIILPLTKDGKMTCITCHNPHEKGTIPADNPSAKGAGSKDRLRLPERLCIECHKM